MSERQYGGHFSFKDAATPAASGDVEAARAALLDRLQPLLAGEHYEAVRAMMAFEAAIRAESAGRWGEYAGSEAGLQEYLAADAFEKGRQAGRAESAGALDVERLAEAMWFEGLISGPPNEDVTKDAAESLLSAYRGLVKHHAADPTP